MLGQFRTELLSQFPHPDSQDQSPLLTSRLSEETCTPVLSWRGFSLAAGQGSREVPYAPAAAHPPVSILLFFPNDKTPAFQLSTWLPG